VCNRTFAEDPVPITLPNTNHVGLCKPTPTYHAPVTELVEVLS
jgi:hypothetical protein